MFKLTLRLSAILVLTLPLTARADIPYPETISPLVLTGERLPQVAGAGIDNIRVYASHNGKWAPIPFQIDEKDSRRKKSAPWYVFPPNRDKNPAFDKDDELVVIASDFGDKALSGAPDMGQSQTAEIAAQDPASGRKAYAYVMVFSSPPPLSPTDYIRWNEKERRVEALGYSVGYPEKDALFFNYLSVPESRGGRGDNFVDTFKMRGNGRSIGQLFVTDIHNGDYRNRPYGVIDGPVRVIRRVRVNFNGMVFRIHEDWVDLVYYPDWFELRAPVKMGIRGPSVNFSADVHLTVDLNEAASGMTFRSSRNPRGTMVNGQSSDAEKGLDYGPSRWFALSGPPGNMVVRMDQSPRSGARQDLYYLDDASRQDPPENNPGQIGNAGFRIMSVNKIPGPDRVFTLKFIFPGDVAGESAGEKISGAFDSPPTVYVGTAAVSHKEAAPALVEKTRWKQDPPRPSYVPPPITQRTRGYLPQVLIDPNLGYGTGFQVVERKTLGTDLSTDVIFLISHRFYQKYRVKLEYWDMGYFDKVMFYAAFGLHPNQFFFGIGNDQTPDDLAVYRHEQFRTYGRVEKYLTEYLFVAFQIGAQKTTIGHGDLLTSDEPSIEEVYGPDKDIIGGRFGPEVYGLDGGWTNSVRMDFAIDLRDDDVYPSKGMYHILETEYTPKWMGSDYEYFRYRLDMRFYFSGPQLRPEKYIPDSLWLRYLVGLQTRRVFAVRLVGQRMEATKIDFAGRKVLDIPYYNRSYFGDQNSSRGHYWAQFTDNDVTFAQFELRWHLWKILDATLFDDVGHVWNDVYDSSEWKNSAMADWHNSWGFGMRFHMIPNMMMRLDYGFSPENPGGLFYVAAWHTF